ncbi:MAG: hypothetical protein LUC90_09235 [Lachnospiraceae bacterium]|nr:hypothetical protein [Lachnospiraceae bacterium]
MKGNEKTMGVNVKKLRRYINSILMAIFLLLPGLVLDFVHDQKITWNWATAVYECIRDCARWAGLHYDNAFQVLSNNLGVLITIVSLFLTMNINIAERSEKKVFGISRKELEDQGMGRWIKFFRVMRVIGFLAPLLMIACIIERWCITGYLLLLFCYIFLVLVSKRVVRSDQQ